MSFWNKAYLNYLFGAKHLISSPNGVGILNPYGNEDVQKVCQAFYSKYYADPDRRTVLLGINPGRFGAGVTGISFTDPEKLENKCGIQNSFPKKEEMSSRFIYSWINRFGTVEEFYSQFIILSVCPLGFVKDGKNINYYDQSDLQKVSKKIIVDHQNFIREHDAANAFVYMLGKGKNYKYFSKLNKEYGWYKKVIPLPHPRWVMQYRYPTRFEIMDEMTMTLKDKAL